MSVYETINKISNFTPIHNRKQYKPDYVVARFHLEDTAVELKFSEYTKERFLQGMRSPYHDKREVCADFWDPEICTKDTLMAKDIKRLSRVLNITSEDKVPIIIGYLITLVAIHNIILQSYTVKDFTKVLSDINIDKQIFRDVFKMVDLSVNYTDDMIEFLGSVLTDEHITDFILLPSGKIRFSLKDFGRLLTNTLRAHDVSALIDSSLEEEIVKINYYSELLKVCSTIYSPTKITSYDSNNVLLSILKTRVDLDLHEQDVLKAIVLYTDKCNSDPIVFDLPESTVYFNFDVLRNTLNTKN